ncbi:MAG: Uma2 family endonuclease [Planctomycetaceae bacterium]|nr:Uma2 family endonuclease [Planctomycetaceae bacterium]
MATVDSIQTVHLQSQLPVYWTIADLQAHLGDITAERIRLFPPPGYATEADVLEIEDREDRLCELEDGILVEKPMGWYESMLALLVARKIGNYLDDHDLGQVLGADGSLKILPGVVKIPDVSFVSWGRFPKERLGRRPIPELIPDLVVEVLSDTNTKKEMAMKLDRYFKAGVRLVWYIDPETRTANAFTSPGETVFVEKDGLLEGGAVLPGFSLSLAWLFERADRQSGPQVDV